jgi:hypothetical protein
MRRGIAIRMNVVAGKKRPRLKPGVPTATSGAKTASAANRIASPTSPGYAVPHVTSVRLKSVKA